MGLKAIFQRGYSRRTQLLALSGSLLLAGGIGYFALASANGEKTPGTANDYFSLASQNLRQGSYQQAVENYRNLLDEHPFKYAWIDTNWRP